ncbi:hypothetical protein JCM3770_001895 [Rhodotorula araucariae]
MDAAVPVLSSKTLVVALDLPESALCPADLDLAALRSPPDAAVAKLALYRTGAAPDAVWEWAPPPPPAPPSTGKLGALGLKGKAKAPPAGKVARVAWNPQGDALAVLVAPPSAAASSPSTVSLLSIHTGTPLVPAAAPLPSSSRPTTLAWQPLALAHDPLLPSWAIGLIDRLPALPKIPKDGLPTAASGAPGAPVSFGAAGPGAGAGAGAGGVSGGGVFGAKQAMLERERAKEAQRALNMQDAAARFPTLLPPARAGDDGTTEAGDPKVRATLRAWGGDGNEADETVLCVGDEDGGMHLYLGGSVYLGSVAAGARLVGTTVLPSPSATTASFALHLSSASAPLSVLHLSLPLPPSLSAVLRQSTALRAHLQYAFDALQDARGLWDEARRIGKGWLQRIADVSRPHGVTTPPATQLHLLLVTGRPTRALHDFLASKMNERGLVKWEGAMALALERLRRVGWMSVAPAMERVVLLLREVDAWAQWPDKFAPYAFAREDVLRATELAKEAIRVSARLQREVEEEERCFKQFSIWLRYELDKVAAQEGAEVRPLAAFLPLPVSSYIQHRLAPTAATLAPFLAFGLASAPLKGNKEIEAVEAWAAALPVGTRALRDAERGLGAGMGAEDGDDTDGARLDSLLRRMAEELQGQIDADELASAASARPLPPVLHAPFTQSPRSAAGAPSEFAPFPRPLASAAAPADPDAAPRPAAPATPGEQRSVSPTSLPALLHLAARLVGGVMDGAVRAATGAQARLDGEVGRVAASQSWDGEGNVRLRTRVGEGGRMEEVWVRGSTITFARQLAPQDLAAIETAAYKLETGDRAALRVIEFAFGLEGEVVIGAEVAQEGSSAKFIIGKVDLDALRWSQSAVPEPVDTLPLAQQHALDPAYPPAALSFRTSASGRLLVAALSGEGRRLEVLDLSVQEVRPEEMQD